MAGGCPVRAGRRGLGRRPWRTGRRALGRGRALGPRPRTRLRRAGAAGHWGPIPARPALSTRRWCSRPTPTRGARWTIWPCSRAGRCRHPDRRGLHRLLYQQPPARPARGLPSCAAAASRRGQGHRGAGLQRQARGRAEGLDHVFRAAGFEWRESGCSLCFFAGGDHFDQPDRPGRRVITSTNRNLPPARRRSQKPATVAASALAGCIADPRPLLS